jgi:hypothetical protein
VLCRERQKKFDLTQYRSFRAMSLVSVIMPTYRMGRFVPHALASLGRQTYGN